MSEDEKKCCGGQGECEEKGNCCGHEEKEHSCGCGCGHHHHDGTEKDVPRDVPLPAPSLVTLASSIATQAMVSMGVCPNPATGKSEFYFNQASHLIDTVDLLIKKTEGNRTEEETRTLTGVLSELQMLFVAAQNEKNRRDSQG